MHSCIAVSERLAASDRLAASERLAAFDRLAAARWLAASERLACFNRLKMPPLSRFVKSEATNRAEKAVNLVSILDFAKFVKVKRQVILD